MNLTNVILSEPQDIGNYYPFSILHPIYELRVGALKNWERAKFALPNSSLSFCGRESIIKSFLERNNLENPIIKKGLTLVIDGAVIINNNFLDELAATLFNYPESSLKLCHHGKPIGGLFNPKNWVENITADDLKNYETGIWDSFSEIELSKTNKLNYIWDCIYNNSELISEDKQFFQKYKSISAYEFPYTFIEKRENIFIGQNIRIMPGTVLDATYGPIIIDSNVHVMHQSTILGPAFIGGNSTIKVGSKIYGGTTIGEWCKVGGEIEDSIIHGYSNKQHDGFLGHSYIGEWVNLGAGTDTSDLKNTYGNIDIPLRESIIKSGQKFLGFICGDHTKTAIGSKINSGTVSGIFANILQSSFPTKSIPSFSWLSDNGNENYKFDKAIEVASTVMKRRNRELLNSEIELMKSEFELISDD